MTAKRKGLLWSMLIFFLTYLVVWFVIRFIFSGMNVALVGGITAAITVVLSPQRKIIQTQSGEKVQLKWLFSKKVIIID